MLVTVKLGADFSNGCALPVIALTFLLTHPPRTLRELTSASTTRRNRERGS
jgi:hypothetical protein